MLENGCKKMCNHNRINQNYLQIIKGFLGGSVGYIENGLRNVNEINKKKYCNIIHCKKAQISKHWSYYNNVIKSFLNINKPNKKVSMTFIN